MLRCHGMALSGLGGEFMVMVVAPRKKKEDGCSETSGQRADS